MSERTVQKRPLFIGILFDVVGAALIGYAALSRSDQHDTVLFAMGAVLMIAAAVFLYMAVRPPKP